MGFSMRLGMRLRGAGGPCREPLGRLPNRLPGRLPRGGLPRGWAASPAGPPTDSSPAPPVTREDTSRQGTPALTCGSQRQLAMLLETTVAMCAVAQSFRAVSESWQVLTRVQSTGQAWKQGSGADFSPTAVSWSASWNPQTPSSPEAAAAAAPGRWGSLRTVRHASCSQSPTALPHICLATLALIWRKHRSCASLARQLLHHLRVQQVHNIKRCAFLSKACIAGHLGRLCAR